MFLLDTFGANSFCSADDSPLSVCRNRQEQHLRHYCCKPQTVFIVCRIYPQREYSGEKRNKALLLYICYMHLWLLTVLMQVYVPQNCKHLMHQWFAEMLRLESRDGVVFSTVNLWCYPSYLLSFLGCVRVRRSFCAGCRDSLAGPNEESLSVHGSFVFFMCDVLKWHAAAGAMSLNVF